MISVVVLTRNRAPFLRQCLKAIRQHSISPHEVIVVDNGSSDGTAEALHDMKYQGFVDTIITSDNSLGVCARNLAFKVAKGEIIAQVDDDVIVTPKWDKPILSEIYGEIGAVGVQGAYVNPDFCGFGGDIPVNGVCDVLTGYCWAFKNEGWLYDERFAPFWHEESELQMRMTVEKGYRKRRIPMICSHNCQRNETTAPMNWELHDRNLGMIREMYKDKFISERLRK